MTTDHNQRGLSIAIIGAGLAGLAAAYDLGRAGHTVVVLEAAARVGGLASSILVDGEPLERFYHFICRPDTDLINLVHELGIGHQLHWTPTRTRFFYNGQMYGFGSPLDLLRFKPVPFWQRVRFGLNVVQSRHRQHWRQLDRLSAVQWLKREIGEQAYEVIWHPLLKVKFGSFYDQISAAWIWHRINRVARSRRWLWEKEQLGYLENGSATVIDALLDRLQAQANVTIRAGVRLSQIVTDSSQVQGVQVQGDDQPIACDAVISTVPLPILLRLAASLPAAFQEQLRQIEYIGVICMLLKLRQPLTDSFWVNIHDPEISFNGFIEYSNLNRHRARLGKAIVYIPYYLPTSEPRYAYPDEQLLQEYVLALKRVNPAFEESWIEEYHVFRADHAQAICVTGFADRVPDHQTPIKGLYVTDSVQFYPEDRTISAAIRLGRKVASMITGSQKLLLNADDQSPASRPSER